MKIIAVDDEKIGLEGLVSAIKEAEPSAEIYDFNKANEALDFYRDNPCEVAFLDIQMRSMSGIELAQNMKLINSAVNIIFATGFDEYMSDAFEIHASGYITKPITPQKVRKELDNLRHMLPVESEKRVHFTTFGNFEMYIDNKPVQFKYEKTRELMAYLVDRKGAYITNAEIMAALWEDDKKTSYLSNLRKDLIDTLKKNECLDIIDTGWGKIRVNVENVDCDYYDWCEGKIQAINLYHGEYMSQYSWAEFTHAAMGCR